MRTLVISDELEVFDAVLVSGRQANLVLVDLAIDITYAILLTLTLILFDLRGGFLGIVGTMLNFRIDHQPNTASVEDNIGFLVVRCAEEQISKVT